MQIKTTMMYHLMPVRMAAIKKSTNKKKKKKVYEQLSAGECVEK